MIDPEDCDHLRTYSRGGSKMYLYLCAVEVTP